jgi:hypothetical protein
MLLVGTRVDEILDISADFIRNHINSLNLSTKSKIIILDIVHTLEKDENPSVFQNEEFANLSEVVCEVVKFEEFKNNISSDEDVKGIQEKIHDRLFLTLGQISTELELAISQCIIRQMVTENEEKAELYSRWRQYAVEERKKVI